MSTHADRDAEIYGELAGKAEEMLKRRESTITAGSMFDTVLFEKERNGMAVRRLADDPLALRISIGEANTSAREKYLVFRGDPQRVRKILRRALSELDELMRNAELV